MYRTWLYQTLVGSPDIVALVGERIYQSTAIIRVPNTKPFILYRTIAHRPELRGDDEDRVKAQTFLIFVHDLPGDYLQIDTILKEIEQLFKPMVGVLWLEDSEDFRDEDLGTITRYARIQVNYPVTD